MALRFMDSFDHYVTADIAEKWATSSGASIVAAAGRHSSAALRLPSSTDGVISRALGVSGTTAIVGVAIKLGSLGGTCFGLIRINSAGSTQVSINVDGSGLIRAYRGNAVFGTLLGTAASGALGTGAFYYIELKTVIHASAGTVEVRVGGVTVLTLSGQNTSATGSAAWDAVELNGGGGSNDNDDLYVLDGSGSAPWADFLGDCRVDARLPTGAGATTGWTPSTGSNWQNVDDAAPDDDSTYNTAASAPLTDTFTVQDAPVVGATIYGVQHCLSARKTDAGTCTLAPVVRHSGSDNVGSDQSPTTSYAYLLAVNQTNPGTAAQWTEAGFNAAEFGYKRTA